MLVIRLQRVGKKKMPIYRLIISDKLKDTHDRYLELLGSYNPHVKENQFVANADRVKYWIGKGAQLSATVNNLLLNAKIILGEKKKSVYLSQNRKAKIAKKST